MVKAIEWLLCAYLVLKLIQYFLAARPGYGTDEPAFREKLLRGEPILFIVACAISVPTALWSTWYFQRGYERAFARSVDCYGRLSGVVNLASVETRFDALRIYRSAKLAKSSASRAAQSLELTPAFVDKTLADKKSFYTARFSGLSRRGDREKVADEAAAIERCINEWFIDF